MGPFPPSAAALIPIFAHEADAGWRVSHDGIDGLSLQRPHDLEAIALVDSDTVFQLQHSREEPECDDGDDDDDDDPDNLHNLRRYREHSLSDIEDRADDDDDDQDLDQPGDRAGGSDRSEEWYDHLRLSVDLATLGVSVSSETTLALP